MRLIYFTLSLLAPAALPAQIITYYTVPPTAGCNGIWAVNGFSISCGAAPYTYTTMPSGCLEISGWTSSADTIFIPLCAVPCSLIVTNADGIDCTGSTGGPAALAGANAAHPLHIVTTSFNIEVTSAQPLPAGMLRLLDLSGRPVRVRSIAAGQQWSIPAPDAPGAYVLVFDGVGLQLRTPLVWAP